MRQWALFAATLLAACSALAAESPQPQVERHDGSLKKPALAWATYVGVEGLTGAAFDVAVDSKGNAVVVGCVGFPAMGTLRQTQPGDGFIAKVSPEGQVLWLTRVGGSAWDSCREVAIDKKDTAYVAGSTRSEDFPTPGGFDTTLGGAEDAFVVEVSPDGEIVWGTLIGGSGEGLNGEYAAGIALDGEGNIWVSGGTDSADFPAPGETSGPVGGAGAFIAKISADKRYERAWFYGNGADEQAGELTFDAEGNIWFLCSRRYGSESSMAPGGVRLQSVVKMPVPDAAWETYEREGSCFFESIARNVLPADVTVETHDGEGRDALESIERNSSILAAGTIRTAAKVPVCGVALKLRLDGAPVWTSDIRRTLRGDGAFVQSSSGLHGLCEDRHGRLWVCGDARGREGDEPESFGRPTSGGDGYVAILGENGQPVWESLLSGSKLDHAYAIAADGKGGVYVVGDTFSPDFATPDAYDTTSGGGAEAFVARIVYGEKRDE